MYVPILETGNLGRLLDTSTVIRKSDAARTDNCGSQQRNSFMFFVIKKFRRCHRNWRPKPKPKPKPKRSTRNRKLAENGFRFGPENFAPDRGGVDVVAGADVGDVPEVHPPGHPQLIVGADQGRQEPEVPQQALGQHKLNRKGPKGC